MLLSKAALGNIKICHQNSWEPWAETFVDVDTGKIKRALQKYAMLLTHGDSNVWSLLSMVSPMRKAKKRKECLLCNG